MQRWFIAEYFYSQMDRAYFWRHGFPFMLESLDIGATLMSMKEWALLRTTILNHGEKPSGAKQRRILFSENFIRKEKAKLYEFRSIFRDIMGLIDQRKELINYIFTSPANE